MKRFLLVLFALAAVAGIGTGGYLLGVRTGGENLGMSAPALTTPPAPKSGEERTEKKVLYYKAQMGPETSPVPKKDSMGMDYVPVYEGADAGTPPPSDAAKTAPKGPGKILYYRNAMNPAATSPVPKKDAMGMDYVPVYEGDEEGDEGTVKISPAKVQKLGVDTVVAELRTLTRTIRAVGTVQADERKLYIVNTKFEGWIEKLHVNATGDTVRRGEPLMEVYAPELVVAEQEYILSFRSLQSMEGASEEARDSSRQLTDSALRRLKNWDISEDQLNRLKTTGEVTRTLTLRAAANGIVLEKMAIEGMRFAPGDPLYRIADLSTVWIIADVFEQDLGTVRIGQDATVVMNAYPSTTFSGKVDFIYPTINADTRTGKVRIVIPNPDGRLKPSMYANVSLNVVVADHPTLVIPESAVIDSGTRQSVLVDRGNGRFEPREVKLGAHADGFYEVTEGLTPNERVVVSANFLIDSESNLKAALKAFAPPKNGADPSQAAMPGADTTGGEMTRKTDAGPPQSGSAPGADAMDGDTMGKEMTRKTHAGPPQAARAPGADTTVGETK